MIWLLIDLVRVAFKIYSVLLIVRILMSWIQPNPLNPLVRFLRRVTDPVLEPFRQLIPSIGGLDLSPMVVLFLLQFLERLVIGLLYQMT